MKIHKAIVKAQVAARYYEIVNPGRDYPIEQALRQFRQDKKIDVKIVRRVINQIFKEQKDLLKTL